MKLLKNLVPLLLAISGLILIAYVLIFLPACASAPPSRRISRCLTDPRNNALHCDGVSMPWGDHFIDYVCHSLDDDAEYMRGCR